MEVYIEYVIIDNLIINYLLMYLSRKSLNLEIKKRRLLLSAVFGTLITVLLPYFKIKRVFLFLVKITLGIALTVLSGHFSRLKEFVFCFYLFLFFTFLFGGGTYAVFFFLGIDYDVWLNTAPVEIPLCSILIICFSIFTLCKKTIVRLHRKAPLKKLVYNCSVVLGGQTFSGTGFLDSGNRLFYKKKDSPIILCSKNLRQIIIESGKLMHLQREFIKLRTLTGLKIISIYKCDKLLIYNDDVANTINNVMIGFIDDEFGDGEEYDILLSPSLVGN